MEIETTESPLDLAKIQQMLQACSTADTTTIQSLVQDHFLYARQQIDSTGQSPLMVAAGAGHLSVVQYLLEQGAPWNAIDRNGQCAGNYATDAQHWEIVNLLVDHGTRAEFILASVMKASASSAVDVDPSQERNTNLPLSHKSSTKPNYLRQRLTFTDTAILDDDKDAVMMQWEKPLMEAHAQIMTDHALHKTVMNVGFGMGIIDTILQTYQPNQHIIVEAHPDVYAKMIRDGWDKKPNVRILFGKWQDMLPTLVSEQVQLDGIFFDTYGEHFTDMQEFHSFVPQLLKQPSGIYSFFNGLAPDNLFFHGVACQCVKIQLEQLGLDTEFLPCELKVPPTKEWEGIRRQYWHGRDTYYLPKSTWKPEFVNRKVQVTSDTMETDAKRMKR